MSKEMPKCAFCNGVIAFEPYKEVIKGKELLFHAKPCADEYKKKTITMEQKRCAFCGGLIAYDPYKETIKGQDLIFHAKPCAVAYKKK